MQHHSMVTEMFSWYFLPNLSILYKHRISTARKVKGGGRRSSIKLNLTDPCRTVTYQASSIFLHFWGISFNSYNLKIIYSIVTQSFLVNTIIYFFISARSQTTKICRTTRFNLFGLERKVHARAYSRPALCCLLGRDALWEAQQLVPQQNHVLRHPSAARKAKTTFKTIAEDFNFPSSVYWFQ